MQTQNQQPTHVLVPKDLFNKVYEYIISKPFKEVAGLEKELASQVKLVALPPEQPEEDTEKKEQKVEPKIEKDEKE